MGTQEGFPLVGVESPLTQPAIHGHGVGLLEQSLEVIGGRGKTEILGQQALGIDDAVDVARSIEQGSSAVTGFDRHGQLQHGASFKIPTCRENSFYDALVQAQGMA